MSITNITAAVLDPATRRIRVAYELSDPTVAPNQVQYGPDSGYGSAQDSTRISTNGFEAIFNASSDTVHFKVVAGGDESPDQVIQISAPAPVDSLSAFADPARTTVGQAVTVTAIAEAGGSPTTSKTVTFATDHGSSPEDNHGSFSSKTAVTGANGECSVQFTPSRPGSIHLRAECEGIPAQFNLRSNP